MELYADWLLLLAVTLQSLLPGVSIENKRRDLTSSEIQDEVIKAVGRLREPPPDGGPTVVELGIYINSFYAISEQTMDYSLNIYLREQWTDPRLAFKRFLRPYDTREKIKLADGTWDQIWTPDVFFRNEKRAAFHKVTTPNRLLNLHRDGRVWYVTKLTATLSCPMKLHKYPLDTQFCPMMFESFGYTMDDLVYRWLPKNPIEISPEIEIPQFKLVNFNFSDCSQNYTTVGYTMENIVYKWLPDPVQFDTTIEIPQYRLVNFTLTDCSQNYTTGAYPCLQVDFTLKRDIGFYMIQMYVPSVLIVILSWVAFWISIDAIPARVTIGLLTVLTMTTQSTGARSQLPRVSYIKAIDVWMSVCLVFVFTSLLEFAVVNVFSRKEFRNSTRATLRRKMGTPREEEIALEQINIVPHNGQEYRNFNQQRFYREIDGRHKARYIDKLSRKLFPLAFLSFNIIYWLSYILG